MSHLPGYSRRRLHAHQHDGIAPIKTDSRLTRKNVQPWVRTDSSAGSTTSAVAVAAAAVSSEVSSASVDGPQAAGAVAAACVVSGFSGSCAAAPGREADASGCGSPPVPDGRPVAAIPRPRWKAPSKPRRRLAEAVMFPNRQLSFRRWGAYSASPSFRRKAYHRSTTSVVAKPRSI